MANVQTRSTLGDLGHKGLGPKFRHVFEQNLIKFTGRDVANQIFSFQNTDRGTERVSGLTGYPTFSEFEEGTPIPQVVNIKGFETVYTIRDYGGVVTVTDNLLQDREQLGKALDEMANLAKSADINEVRSAFQILNGAFVTTATINETSIHRFNDEALCVATHARADGGTAQSNISAGAIQLTELNLETGRLALVKQLTDVGLPIIDMGMIQLVVPDDLEKNAVIFTGSQLRASTANNDLNFYRGRLNVISGRWLNADNGGSSTAWFLLAKVPGMESPLTIYRKGGPRFYMSERDGTTWNQYASVKNRYAVGNSEWKGTWGSQGTG